MADHLWQHPVMAGRSSCCAESRPGRRWPRRDKRLAEVRQEDASSASGVISTVQQIGSALGIAVVGVIFFGPRGTLSA